MAILFKNITADEMHKALASGGVSLRLARQLQASVLNRGKIPAAMDGVSPKTLAFVRSATSIPRLELVKRVVSPKDAFAKYLFKGDGAGVFEAVRIPIMHRPEDRKYIVCVSSQVGCAMGCDFCLTGSMGFGRNLAAWEIVDQVAQIQADSQHPVRGVVFMGMGEPMLNYDAVIKAAGIMSEPCGLAISGKAITISTAGVTPGIRRFTSEGHPYRLVVSLTSADPIKRSKLMPVEKTYPSEDLIKALREYHEATGQRVVLALTLISGLTCVPEEAGLLAAAVKGLPVKLDLIDVNDPSGRFKPPSREELDAFRDALTAELGMPVARRYSGGQDISAACGMLAGSSADPAC